MAQSGGRSPIQRKSTKASVDADDDGDEEPPPPPANISKRRSTVKRLLAVGEREARNEALEQQKRDEEEPLSELIPMKVAMRLRDIVSNFARELPKDSSEYRMARLRAPKSSTGAVLREGASVTQAASHAAMRVLEEWVRVLRPFAATGPELSVLIARIVHMDPQKSKDGWESGEKGKDHGERLVELASGVAQPENKYLEVVPSVKEPLGVALRRVVPSAESLTLESWPWIEDVLHALSYQESFDRTSFVHQSSGSLSRPKTTGQINKKEAQDPGVRMRLSGNFPWSNFQDSDGFRSTTTSFVSEKQLRKIPGPGLYGDYVKNLSKPGTAPRAVYPSVGDRRARCIATPLSVLDRFFAQDFPTS